MTDRETGVPILAQTSWLYREVNKSIKTNKQYVTPIITKDFKPTIVSVSFILRILRFSGTTKENDITAILADKTHKILARFRFASAIVNFENKHNKRMTYNTINCLIHIHNANLIFMNTQDINRDFGFTLSGELEVAVLDIHDFDVFLRDPYLFTNSIENKLKFVYDEAKYDELCRKKKDPEVFGDLMDVL